MRKFLSPLLMLSFCFLSQMLHAQSQVNVNTSTGAANIMIPIDVVSRGAITVPVNLAYSGTGIKPKDVEMNAGMGWQVQTGGQVVRQVRGLPDDCKKDLATNSKLGWIYNTNQSKISSFAIQNNGSTCANETADIAYLNNNFSFTSDSEPDLFYVNAPGLSCQLVWDQSLSTPGFRTIPYQDLVITPTFDAATGAIINFTIVNDQGVKYEFSSFETVKQTTVIASGISAINYLKNTYNQYQNGITFNNNWHLTSIKDINGSGVDLTYTTAAAARSSTDPVILYAGAAGGTTTRIPQYSILQTVSPKTLYQIGQIDGDGFRPMMTFTWTTSPTTQMLISQISCNGKLFSFNYNNVIYNNSYSRFFLGSFISYGCSSPVNYRFAYAGESYSISAGYTTILSDSTSKNIDYWGYFNSNPSTDLKPALYVNPSNSSYARYAINVSSTVGADYTNSLSGTNRSATPVNVMAGSLTKVYYATGGNSTITYNSNDYLDIPANTVIQGGGVRVKQIVDSAVNSPVSIIRTYDYNNPSTSKSSGKPVSLPQFAFTTPYTGTATGNDYWNYATVRSETDLSPEDHTIMYEYVRESKNGAGSTLYQFYLPAMNWDNTASPACASCTADWIPTINYVGRTNCAVSYGPVKNYAGSYPFAPNINYDMERGLPVKVSHYDDELLKIAETSYTYQRTSVAPAVIPALEIEDNTGSGLTVKGYSRYAIYASIGELTSTAVTKIFDDPGASASQSSTTNYFYGATQHKLMKQTATNSDGSIITNNFKYAKDFTATGSNPDVVAISNLQAKNMNLPIETFTQVTRGGTTVTTSATLNRYQAVTVNGGTSYLPLQQLKFFSANGDAGFQPYAIISGTPQNYTGYSPVINYKAYDDQGNLATTDDGHKHVRTVITSYWAHNPAAIFTNAGLKEVAFGDFDSAAGFTLSGTYISSPSSHAGQAVNFSTSQNFSGTLTKNTQANNYLFSIWINAPVGTNSLSFTLTGGVTSVYSKTYTGTGTWKYYQFSIPVSNMPASFSMMLTSGVNIAVDDLLFYPENAEVTTYYYDQITQFKLTETNTNGVSAYYTYDNWGRLLYTYDQDKNLVQKNSYVTPADLQNFGPPSVSIMGADRYSGKPISFANGGYSSCTNVAASSSWDFGDGTTATSLSSLPITHTYASAGTYTVTLTATSPLFGTQTVTQNIIITTAPPPTQYVTLSYTNYTTSNGNISNVSFNNGVDLVINVSGAQLNGYQIPKSSHPYTITVTLSGGTQYDAGTGTGYGCVYLIGGNSPCRDYDVHNTNTYAFLNYDLSAMSALSFTIYKTNCANSLVD